MSHGTPYRPMGPERAPVSVDRMQEILAKRCAAASEKAGLQPGEAIDPTTGEITAPVLAPVLVAPPAEDVPITLSSRRAWKKLSDWCLESKSGRFRIEKFASGLDVLTLPSRYQYRCMQFAPGAWWFKFDTVASVDEAMSRCEIHQQQFPPKEAACPSSAA